MSTYSIKCEYCGGRLEAETRYIGYEFPCPACKQSFVLPLTAMTAGMVAGDFWLQKRVGSGNISEVFVGKRLATNEHVFIKVLSPLVTANHDVARQFLAAICASAKFDCPGLVKPLEVVEANGHSFVVTPYVEGECLDVVVGRDGPLRERQALKLVLRAARVLRSLWDEHGLAHGDIKPANILVDGQENVHLLDAGNAKMLFRHAGLTLERLDRNGTIADYLSPEQARGDRPVDQRTDIYALGVTLYFLLTGAKPYAGADTTMVLQEHLNAPVPDPHDRNPEVSPGTRQLLFRMTAKAPVSRFQTWDELIDELRRRLEGTIPGAETRRGLRTRQDLKLAAAPPPAPAPARHRPLSPAVILVGSVALLLVLGVIAGWFVVNRHTGPPPPRPLPGDGANARNVTKAGPPAPPLARTPRSAGEEAVPADDLIGTKILNVRGYLKKNPARYDFAVARLESFVTEAKSDGERERIRAEIARVKKAQADAMSGAFGGQRQAIEALAQGPAPWFRDFVLLGPLTGDRDRTWGDIRPAPGVGLPDLLAVVRDGDRLLTWSRPESNHDQQDFRRLLPPPHENVHVYALAEIAADQPADVQFDTVHSDGLTVWLNGRQVFTADGARAGLTARVALVKGRNVLLLRVAQNAGPWHLQCRVVAPDSGGRQPVGVAMLPIEQVKRCAPPPEEPVKPPQPAKASTLGNLEPGLLTEVFGLGGAVNDFPVLAAGQAPTVTKTDAQVNVENPGNKWPGTELKENFYIRWTGVLKIEKAGKYKLYTVSDDGSRLFLAGQQIVDNGGLHGMTEKGSDELELTAGAYALKIEFFQAGLGAGCQLLWETAGGKKQPVPAAALWHGQAPAAKPPAAGPRAPSGQPAPPAP